MGLDQLVNSGVARIGDDAAMRAQEKTLVVVGPGRGGTSLVAGALHHLGVFTGDESTAPVFEDRRLAGPCQRNAAPRVKAIMRDYDERHSVWAYKRPSIVNNFAIVDNHARNPVYLFIFKDIFSIANRNSISMQIDMLKGLRDAQRAYERIIDFVDARQPNGLLFSYDRIMQNREGFVDQLIELLPEGAVDPARRTAAIDFIEPNPTAYLDTTRVTRSVGTIESLSSTAVSGTALYEDRPEKKVAVELIVDGTSRAVVDAVRDPAAGSHRFSIPIEPPLQPGQRAELRTTEDVAPFARREWT